MNAKEMIIKAINCENNNCLFEAEYHYMHGIENLLKLVNGKEGEEKKRFLARINTYIQHVDEIKVKVEYFKSNVNILKVIPISEDSTKHTFDNLFGSYFDESVREMIIEEPYLTNWPKISTLVAFFEFAFKKCPFVSFIKVITKKNTNGDQSNQLVLFSDIKKDFSTRNILIHFYFDEDLHDRKIITNNGIIVKIGRGLDFYKPIENSMGLGVHDFYYRKCKKTEVEIMRSTEKL